MATYKVSKVMRNARYHLDDEQIELNERIDQLLVVQGKLASLKTQSINLKSFYDRLVDFTDQVLTKNLKLKKMLRRLHFFKLFSKNRKNYEQSIKEFRFIVRKEEINLNLYKQNMQKVCKINNHLNDKVCIFCL